MQQDLFKALFYAGIGGILHQLINAFVYWVFEPEANRDYLRTVLEQELQREITEEDIDDDIARTAGRWCNCTLVFYTLVIIFLIYKGVIT